MVEISEIRDANSLKAWLRNQPNIYLIILANRAAKRVLPSQLSKGGLVSKKNAEQGAILPFVRATILTQAIERCEDSEALLLLNDLADSAASKLGSTSPIGKYTQALIDSVYAATRMEPATYAVKAIMATFIPPQIESFWPELMWRVVRADCKLLSERVDTSKRKLWPIGQNPLIEQWNSTKRILAIDISDWSFWIKWYECELSGKPLNRDMLEQIAMIPSDDWEKGPEHVNGLIAQIEEEFLLAATPIAEKVELNHETGRLRIVPERMSQKALYNNILEKIRDGMADLRDSPQFDNALSALGPVFEKMLDRTFDKYLSSPQRVHDDFIKAKRRIQKLLDVGEVAPNDEVIELVEDLDSGAAHIRANMPQVRDSMAALAALRIAEASDADIEGIRAGAEAIAAQSEPEMAEEMREDAAEIVASRDVPLGAPKVLAPEETYRLAHRIVESKRILTKANALKAGVVATGAFTGAQMIEGAVQILLRLLGF